jgi:hypothetical protein
MRERGSGPVTVLVDKSTKDVDAFDPLNLRRGGWRRLNVGGRHAKVDAAVRTGGVVVLHVGEQHPVGS